MEELRKQYPGLDLEVKLGSTQFNITILKLTMVINSINLVHSLLNLNGV